MFTKMPDYIISECGCPDWYDNNNNKNINNNKYYSKAKDYLNARKMYTESAKLLPLRETLSEYYKRLLAEQLDLLKCGRANANFTLDTAAQHKQQKNQRNEYLKQRQQQQQHSLQNQPNPHSTRNFSDKSSWSSNGTRDGQLSADDSDLDVF